ncbi:MAG TPA: heme-binding protein [Methanomassiliicoccales archaeon]|nr:heme-binding protein [Methanomassiliicoccales archaeon]HQQ24851.1 heme-binding protein [Methanomassiliicoccales archaeon]
MVKSVPYEVVKHLGEAELRRYGDMVLATVYDMDEEEAFQLLFQYINGNNERESKLAMTAPVVSRSGEPADPSSEGMMAFVLPSEVPLAEAPKPSDPRVTLELKEGGLFAVMRFRGRAGGVDVQGRTEDLRAELKEADYVMDGRPFLMRYNSLFTPGFMRYNEVAARVVPGPEKRE